MGFGVPKQFGTTCRVPNFFLQNSLYPTIKQDSISLCHGFLCQNEIKVMRMEQCETWCCLYNSVCEVLKNLEQIRRYSQKSIVDRSVESLEHNQCCGSGMIYFGSSFEFSEFRIWIQAKVPDPFFQIDQGKIASAALNWI